MHTFFVLHFYKNFRMFCIIQLLSGTEENYNVTFESRNSNFKWFVDVSWFSIINSIQSMVLRPKTIGSEATLIFKEVSYIGSC